MTARSNQQDRQPEPDQLSFRQYTSNVRLLRRMPRPEIPAELRDPAFLEAIYERAVEASGALHDGDGAATGGLGTVLTNALPPLVAPGEVPTAGDMVAEEAADQPGLTAHFAASRNGTRAPGWLWQRIRADLREQQSARRRAGRVFRLRAAAAAAVVLVAVGTGAWLLRDGGVAPDEIVIQEWDQPMGGPVHPSDLLRQIAGGGE